MYRQRWQVELFFKWIKQHLRIKAFLGTSENAVKTQIWIAVCTYVLIAIVKKRLHLPHSLYEILQILSLTMFETTPINQLLTPPSTQFRAADFEPINSSLSSEKRWDTTAITYIATNNRPVRTRGLSYTTSTTKCVSGQFDSPGLSLRGFHASSNNPRSGRAMSQAGKNHGAEMRRNRWTRSCPF